MSNILLYVHKSAAQDIYLKLCAELDVEVEVISTFDDLCQASVGRKYSGLLVDIISNIRASSADRLILKELMEVYPTLRLRWDPAGGNVRTLMSGAGAEQSISIATFVSQYCAAFVPQAMRLHSRREIYCGLWRSSTVALAEETSERTITADVSAGGCFIYSSTLLCVGDILWLRFVNLVDKKPIQGVVVWCREWGTLGEFPGAGLRFLDITPQQQQEIADLLGGARGN